MKTFILDEDDAKTWSEYTAGVKPMHGRKKSAILPTKTHKTHEKIPIKQSVHSSNIQPRTARDLKNVKIQARLDLHGLTLEKAHERIIHFILNAHHVGHRCVLVITGKGTNQPKEWWQENGILRQQVPRWLQETPINSKIISHCTAKPEHGGTGAIYIFLRKHKERSIIHY